MRSLVAASLLSLTMVLGVAGTGWATLHFDCDHVTVHVSATVEVPPCIRHDEINESPAGCERHVVNIGSDCDSLQPLGTAVVDCTFRTDDYTGSLDLTQQGTGHISGSGQTIVPFYVDQSGEYEISFTHEGGGNCGSASVLIHGPGGVVGGGSWPSADSGSKSFRVILLTGLSYDITFQQAGQTDEECQGVVDELSRFEFAYVGDPERACCDLMTGGCSLMTADPCRELGREWHPEWVTCSPDPCPDPMPGAALQLGDWIDPEPWHDWVAATPGSVIRVQLYTGDLAAPVDSVRFYYSRNHGASWEYFATDYDGTEPWLNTTDLAVHAAGDGWFAELPVPELPDPLIQFKIQAYTGDGVYETRGEQYADGAPPTLTGVTVSDWETTDRDTLGIGITPDGTTLTWIVVYRSSVGDTYTKGIPGIDEHMISEVHCVPAASAQCLKYFESHGDLEVTGGLDDSTLVWALGQQMYVDPVKGVSISKWTAGLSKWIHNHGNGYTVQAYRHFTNGGAHTWIEDDWLTLRNELERSQDVMVGVFWSGGGGHALTLDSITNPRLPNGRYLLGFKDPWGGQTSTGELDPLTGDIYNMTGSGAGRGGYLGLTLLACPREEAVNMAGPGMPIFDGLPPGPPYLVSVPLPDPGLYFLHFVVVNSSGHAYRTTRLVVKTVADDVLESTLTRPMVCELGPPVPNPFRTLAQISYRVPIETPVNLTIFDVAGRKVRVLFDGVVQAGSFRATWDGRDHQGRPAASGIYYVKLRTPDQQATQRLVLLR